MQCVVYCLLLRLRSVADCGFLSFVSSCVLFVGRLSLSGLCRWRCVVCAVCCCLVSGVDVAFFFVLSVFVVVCCVLLSCLLRVVGAVVCCWLLCVVSGASNRLLTCLVLVGCFAVC